MPKLRNRVEIPAVRLRLPDGSRTHQSPWVWRGMFFFSLIALGICLMLVTGNQISYALAWAVIAAGWFAISMWQWRRHTQYHRG